MGKAKAFSTIKIMFVIIAAILIIFLFRTFTSDGIDGFDI